MAVLGDLCMSPSTSHRDWCYKVEFYTFLNPPVHFVISTLTIWMQYQKCTYITWYISISAKCMVSLPSSMVLISSLCSITRKIKNKKETHSGAIKLVKVTRLEFEPRTFWMYPRCSNQLSYPAVSVPVTFSLIPCTLGVPTPCTTYVNLVTA